MNAARASLLALLVCWAASALSVTALAVVAVPPLVGRVVDQTGTLGSGDVASLNQTIRDFESRKGSQIAVLIVPTTDGEAIEQFSLRVAETWKIGRKKIDDGAVLVIAKNDRHLRIEVGYGLEGALTDVTTKRIIDEEITPKFKSGDFAGGVSAGVSKMIRVIDGEKLPAPEPPHWQNTGLFDVSDMFNPFLLIPVFLLGGVMRSMLGRLVGSAVSGGVVTLVAWFLFGSLLAAIVAGLIATVFVLFNDAVASPMTGGRSRGGGWSGGSSGGSWSSGGGGWSGGSSSDSGGGGGSFGGGGASGSW
ncbi:MAG: YgcG family protein [Rhizobiales bacterium]|nr:YgcG family protein [Hyphomicrobiales bacterium]